MRQIKKRNWPVMLTLVISLTLSMTACQTSPKIEYVHDIPDVTFPVFPPPDCVTFDEETGLVSMPLWYWLLVANYKIDVDAARDYLEKLRKVQNEHSGF
jgi:hypothetical protein